MTNLVLDSNVYISAAIYGGTPRNLFRFVTKQRLFALFVSLKIQNEVVKALRLKFNISENEIELFWRLVWENSICLQPKIKVDICRDPNDNHILALAIEAKADYILTGDKDLLVLGQFQNISILTPAEFLSKEKSELWK